MGIQRPTSDRGRQELLAQMVRTATQPGAPALLRPDTLAAIQTVQPAYVAAWEAVATARSERTQAIKSLETAVSNLAGLVRKIWGEVRWQVQYGSQPASLCDFYEMTRSGRIRQPTNREGWIALGDRIQSGHARALAAGFPEVPEVAQLETLTTAAATAQAALLEARQVLSNGQKELFSQRQAADRWIRQAIQDLRSGLLTEPVGRQQDSMRNYGLQFKSRATASDQPEEAPRERALVPAAEPVQEPVQGWQVDADAPT